MMSYRPAMPEMTLTGIGEEHRQAVRIGRYRIGQRALFYPAFPLDGYIALKAVTRVWSRDSSVHVTGCCAGGVPVQKLWVQYAAGGTETRTLEYILDTREQALDMLELLRERCPQVAIGAPEKADPAETAPDATDPAGQRS